MQITHTVDQKQQRLSITVSGAITQDNACSLIQYTLSELDGGTYQQAMLDLRGVSSIHPITLFRLHALLQVLTEVVTRRNLRFSILFNEDDRGQWLFLDKAVNCEGNNMKGVPHRKHVRPR